MPMPMPVATTDEHAGDQDQDAPNMALHPTPKKQLGKRNQTHLSPPAKRQTRSSAKKQRIGDDDRAANEAKSFLANNTRNRRKGRRG